MRRASSIVRGLTDQVSQRLVTHNDIEENRIYTLISDEFLSLEAMSDLKLSIQKELSNLPQRFRQASEPS